MEDDRNVVEIQIEDVYNNSKYTSTWWLNGRQQEMNSDIHRALVFQGGGSLGAYEAGAYKDINEELSLYLKAEGRGNEPIFHIVSGTSIGAINAAILVSYVKENKTWEGSGERLVDFWKYLSTQSY